MKKKHSPSRKNSAGYTRSPNAYDGNMEITNLRFPQNEKNQHKTNSSPQNGENFSG